MPEYIVRFRSGMSKRIRANSEAEARMYALGQTRSDEYVTSIERDKIGQRKYNSVGRNAGDVRIVHNRILGGWYVVRGSHNTPIGGKFGSRDEAVAWLNRRNS